MPPSPHVYSQASTFVLSFQFPSSLPISMQLEWLLLFVINCLHTIVLFTLLLLRFHFDFVCIDHQVYTTLSNSICYVKKYHRSLQMHLQLLFGQNHPSQSTGNNFQLKQTKKKKSKEFFVFVFTVQV